MTGLDDDAEGAGVGVCSSVCLVVQGLFETLVGPFVPAEVDGLGLPKAEEVPVLCSLNSLKSLDPVGGSSSSSLKSYSSPLFEALAAAWAAAAADVLLNPLCKFMQFIMNRFLGFLVTRVSVLPVCFLGFSDLRFFEAALLSYMHAEHGELMSGIVEGGDYSDDIEASFKSAIEPFKSTQTW